MDEGRLRRVGMVAGVVYGIAFLFLCAILIGSALSLKSNVIYHWTELRPVANFTFAREGQPDRDIVLPTTLSGLAPGERITLTSSVETTIHDNLLIKTTGAPLRMYVADNLYLSIGLEGTYPAFQKRPSPDIDTVAMPTEAGIQQLRFEYTVPYGANSLDLPLVYVGDSQVLFAHLLTENGLMFTIAVLLLLSGIVLVGLGLIVASRVPAAHSFFWLGFACLATGLWAFCDNDLTLYLIPLPSLLYTFACLGLFSLSIPFLKYGSLLLALEGRPPTSGSANRVLLLFGSRSLLDVLYTLMRLLLLVLLILHLSGIVPFSQSASLMQALTPATIALFAAFVLFEHFGQHNPQAARLVLPVVVFALFALASILDIVPKFFDFEGAALQIGVLLFTFWMAFLGWGYVRDVFDEADKSAALEVEMDAMNRNLDMQRALYHNLTQSTEEVRALRHDLRHQLSAIRGYLQTDDVEGALNYVETIADHIPDLANKLLCDNFAVNAVAVHYLDQALSAHIQTDIRLVVPVELGRIPDNDMSIIVGNLFENAIEACLYVPEDRRFIRIRSTVTKNRLTLVIDNSFDGTCRVVKGVFYSRKRVGKGIGISSVRAIVEKYDGALKYEAANGVFTASLYVKM
jgi:hypothetical protein